MFAEMKRARAASPYVPYLIPGSKENESPTDGSVGFILENAGTCFPFSSATKRWRSPKGIPADVKYVSNGSRGRPFPLNLFFHVSVDRFEFLELPFLVIGTGNELRDLHNPAILVDGHHEEECGAAVLL